MRPLNLSSILSLWGELSLELRNLLYILDNKNIENEMVKYIAESIKTKSITSLDISN